MNRPHIAPVASEADLALARNMFAEYIEGLGVDLSFQNVESELAELPGRYAPPSGIILLAKHGEAALGCGALRRLEPAVCEMKRLYVRRAARGQDLGRLLALALVDHARRAGYERMRLDTLASMQSAQKLYASLGFRAIAPYTKNPLPGTQFLELEL